MGNYAAIAGGYCNAASGNCSFIGGGGGYAVGSTASGNHSVIGGGLTNTASGCASFVGGGLSNTSSGTLSFIGGGQSNTVSGFCSFIGGGKSNTVSSVYSGILGGKSNLVCSGASDSFIIGSNLTATVACYTYVNNLQACGTIRATSDVIAFYSSDERLKNNKQPLTGSLEKLNQISGYGFDWIPMPGIHENEGHDIGVMAQEIEKIAPELVVTRDNGYKAVKYDKITALLIEAVKELSTELSELKKQINK